MARFEKGDYQKAKKDLERSVELSPKMPDGLNSFAWFLATCPVEQYRNGELAVEYAELACDLSNWNDWSFVETLSAAQAEIGDFEAAIEMAKKAQELAPEHNHSELEERIRLFKSEKPFRSQDGKS